MVGTYFIITIIPSFRMSYKKQKVFVALSGGVDSSTATALLLEQGFDCQGIYMITCDEGLQGQLEAEKVAEKLKVKLHVLDLREDFQQILDYFAGEYKKARTPNPCVFCNRHFKFGKVMAFALDNGANFFATGHYARILKHQGQSLLYQAVHLPKDQSYALAMIKRDVLGKVIFPNGDYTKDQIRQLAAKFHLGTEDKVESQEICFIPDDDYISVLEEMSPDLARGGDIVDSDGNILSRHDGIHRFTIGQRKGLGVAMGKPYYVTKLDAATNTVTLGPKEQVLSKKLIASDPNWLTDIPAEPFEAIVKIRYNYSGEPATVFPQTDTVTVEFDEPISAITPGQLAVFYIKDDFGQKVAGSAWIENAVD